MFCDVGPYREDFGNESARPPGDRRGAGESTDYMPPAKQYEIPMFRVLWFSGVAFAVFLENV